LNHPFVSQPNHNRHDYQAFIGARSVLD
jgi:hypothetical protein